MSYGLCAMHAIGRKELTFRVGAVLRPGSDGMAFFGRIKAVVQIWLERSDCKKECTRHYLWGHDIQSTYVNIVFWTSFSPLVSSQTSYAKDNPQSHPRNYRLLGLTKTAWASLV